MKHVLDRSAVQLVLCQKVMEMDVDELTDAFERATGESLEEGGIRHSESYLADNPLSSLIGDCVGLERWLAQMRNECHMRLKPRK